MSYLRKQQNNKNLEVQRIFINFCIVSHCILQKNEKGQKFNNGRTIIVNG